MLKTDFFAGSRPAVSAAWSPTQSSSAGPTPGGRRRTTAPRSLSRRLGTPPPARWPSLCPRASRGSPTAGTASRWEDDWAITVFVVYKEGIGREIWIVFIWVLQLAKRRWLENYYKGWKLSTDQWQDVNPRAPALLEIKLIFKVSFQLCVWDIVSDF